MSEIIEVYEKLIIPMLEKGYQVIIDNEKESITFIKKC